eukprot:g21594.t1
MSYTIVRLVFYYSFSLGYYPENYHCCVHYASISLNVRLIATLRESLALYMLHTKLLRRVQNVGLLASVGMLILLTL